MLAGALAGQAEEGRAGASAAGDDERHDVPAEQLVDADSRWARCAGLRVHYKLALPQVSGGAEGD